MRTYDRNGDGFTVSFNKHDANKFASRWPGSTVVGSGSFSFDGNGDLVAVNKTLCIHAGDDWLAFSRDCERWGQEHIGALRRRHHALQKRVEALYSVQLHKLPKV